MGFFFIELLVIIVQFLILWNRGRAGWETLAVSFGAKRRRTEDISRQDTPIPPELKFAAAKLEELTFRRLGEVQVGIPGGRKIRSRIYLSKDKTVFAELAESQAGIIVFTTVFPDDAVVETGFPIGETINTRSFRSHTVTADLETAYRHQVQQVGEFGKNRAKPRKIKTMEDYLAWDAMYRAKHVARKMRRHTWLGVWQLAALAYGLLALVGAVIYWLGSDMSTFEPLVVITFFLLVALLPAAIVSFLLPYIGDWGNRRDSK